MVVAWTLPNEPVEVDEPLMSPPISISPVEFLIVNFIVEAVPKWTLFPILKLSSLSCPKDQ